MSKLIRTILVAAIVLTGLYFGGGIIAHLFVNQAVFHHRGSDASDLLKPENVIFKQRADYPVLAKRSIHHFASGDNQLTGYYYQASSSKGLVLAVHGMGGCSDDDNAEYQQWFLGQSYSVFALDLTASGQSEGNSMISLAQSAYDVRACYDYLNASSLLEDKVIFVGHSWGAYGIAASLGLGAKADYVITFAAFDNPFDTMMQYARNYAGWVADFTYPAFGLSSAMVHGNDAYLSASKALTSSSTKALVIQGEDDVSVRYDGNSLYHHVLDLPNVEPCLLKGYGHTGLWRSQEANTYAAQEVLPKIKQLQDNPDELASYVASVDKEKTSALNDEVFSKITTFLAN